MLLFLSFFNISCTKSWNINPVLFEIVDRIFIFAFPHNNTLLLMWRISQKFCWILKAFLFVWETCFSVAASTRLHSATKYRGNRRSSSYNSATRLLKKEKAIPSALQLVSSDLRIHTIISKWESNHIILERIQQYNCITSVIEAV